MKRIAHARPTAPGCYRSNMMAMLVAFVAVSVLYFDFQPTPAGADTASSRVVIASTPVIVPAPPKLPEPPSVNEAADGRIAEQPAVEPEPLTPEQQLAAVVNQKIATLEKGAAWLERIPDYTAQFFKRELVSGVLQDEQVVHLKIRHAPFSVYMKWLVGDKGREVLYVDGENEGRMLVHAGGWKARLPALKLDPTGSLAMNESRYPITKAGLLELTRLIVDYRRNDLRNNLISGCQFIDHQTINDRPCCCYVVEYADPKSSAQYRKSITFIDKEWSVPVCIKNYTWPAEDTVAATPEMLDEATLIELYSYSDIRFNQQLADMDFDKANTDYTFRR